MGRLRIHYSYDFFTIKRRDTQNFQQILDSFCNDINTQIL